MKITIQKNILFKRCTYLSILLWIIVSLFTILKLTISTDEAWTLLGIFDLLDSNISMNNFQPVITTSGGLHFGIHYLITLLFENNIVPHRLVSTLFLIITIPSLFYYSKTNELSFFFSMILLLSVPGALYLYSSAYAAPVVVFLVIILILIIDSRLTYIPKVLIGSFLLGICIATRTQCLILIPSIIIWSLLSHKAKKEISLYLLVSFLSFLIYKLLTGLISDDLRIIKGSTGEGTSLLDYGRILNAWAILNTNYSFLIIFTMLITIVSYYIISNERTSPHLIVPIFVVLSIALWLFKSPIPHIRYLWPAMPILYIEFGFVIGKIVKNFDGKKLLPYLIWGTLIFALLSEIGVGIRNLFIGNSNYIGWEYSREVLMERPKGLSDFSSIDNQTKIVEYIENNIPEGDSFIHFGPIKTMKYLLENKYEFYEINDSIDKQKMFVSGNYIIFTPLIGSYMNIDQRFIVWLRENANEIYNNEDYAIYQINDKVLGMPEGIIFKVHSYLDHPNL